MSKKFLPAVVIGIILAFFLGRFSYFLGKSLERPVIRVVPDVNPKVCLVQVESVSTGFLAGKVKGWKTRFQVGEKFYEFEEESFKLKW